MINLGSIWSRISKKNYAFFCYFAIPKFRSYNNLEEILGIKKMQKHFTALRSTLSGSSNNCYTTNTSWHCKCTDSTPKCKGNTSLAAGLIEKDTVSYSVWLIQQSADKISFYPVVHLNGQRTTEVKLLKWALIGQLISKRKLAYADLPCIVPLALRSATFVWHNTKSSLDI